MKNLQSNGDNAQNALGDPRDATRQHRVSRSSAPIGTPPPGVWYGRPGSAATSYTDPNGSVVQVPAKGDPALYYVHIRSSHEAKAFQARPIWHEEFPIQRQAPPCWVFGWVTRRHDRSAIPVERRRRTVRLRSQRGTFASPGGSITTAMTGTDLDAALWINTTVDGSGTAGPLTANVRIIHEKTNWTTSTQVR